MKLWLASTDPEKVAQCFQLGLFVGVLTNPTTLAAAGRPTPALLRDLCAATAAPVFYQLKHTSVEDMKKQTDTLLLGGAPNLGIKVPLTREGCAVLHWLRDRGIKLRLATAVATPSQLLLAVALDVPWVTPSGSASEKLGGPPKLELLSQMQTLLDRQHSPTSLIPSLNNLAEMQSLGLAGLRNGFIWDRDVDRFVNHELANQIVAGFDAAWKQLDAGAAGTY